MKTLNFFVVIAISIFFLLPIRSYANELTPNEQEENVTTISGMEVIVNCNNLNLRSAPSTSSSVVTTIPFGTILTVLNQTGKWFEVNYNGYHGYVFWQYISFVQDEILPNSNLIGNSIIHYTSSFNRDTNISIACKTINGTILNPGETFYWSEIVGQTTAEKGYLTATVIVNRKPTPGLGGGVCQVSTTLYNALLDTNIVPDEVHRHSIGSAYAKQDATVAYGSKDFVFTNSYDFPIQIEAYSYKAVVFVTMYKVE